MSPVPLIVGAALWAGATYFLLDDAIRTGHLTAQHMLMPVLTASTVASAVYAHHRLCEWKVFAAALFAVLALLGSALTVYGTLGRVAADKDTKLGDAMRDNRALEAKLEELKAAKAGAKAECGKIGPRCAQWQARVDALTRETASMSTRALNPQADALVKVAKLLGASETFVRELIDALDAPSLPLFLEFGSIVFFAAGFPHRRKTTVTVAAELPSVARQVFSRGEAPADFRKVRSCGSQQFLAGRWGVHEGTVSKWVASWESDGLVRRNRGGKEKAVLALPAPAPEPVRRQLGHMVRAN